MPSLSTLVHVEQKGAGHTARLRRGVGEVGVEIDHAYYMRIYCTRRGTRSEVCVNAVGGKRLEIERFEVGSVESMQVTWCATLRLVLQRKISKLLFSFH